MSRKLFAVVSLFVMMSMVFTACAPTTTPATAPPPVVQTVIVQGTPQTIILTPTPQPAAPKGPEKKVLVEGEILGSGDIPTIDPALSSDTGSVQIVEETTVGLTRPNDTTSAAEPGMATKWDVSSDGLVYTFHLRNDVPWVKYDKATDTVKKVQDCNGKDRMVTAKDFEYGTLRTLAPKTASDYAYVLNALLKGAADYNSGTITDTSTVGVKAVDDQTLEMTFLTPAAYNASVAGMWVAHAQPSWLIDGDDCTQAAGDRWTETGFFQGYGPYTLKEWVHDNTLTIIKNPFWPGSDSVPQPKIDEVTFPMLDQNAVFAGYEAGNIDTAGVPTTEIDRVKADPTLSKEYFVAPRPCTYYYGFNTKAPVVDDVRVRKALSMAIDRQGLIDNVTKGGQDPAQWFDRPGLTGSPTMKDHPDLGIKFDAAGAKALLDEYLKEKGTTADKLDLTLVINAGAGHEPIAQAIQQMWKDTLGIDVKLAAQEWKVFLKTTRAKDTPQIFRLGWCQDYPDANNFDREVFALGGSENPSSGGGVNWNNPDFEKLVKDAAVETDPTKRVDLYAQAEDILVNKDAVIAPIYWYTYNRATKPYVTRTISANQEHYEKWDIDMAAKDQAQGK